jgi:hypothetical protein
MSLLYFFKANLWIFGLFILTNSIYQEQMEDDTNILAPMHEKFIKDLIDDVMIKSFFKLVGEDVVVLVDNRKHLNKLIGTFWTK